MLHMPNLLMYLVHVFYSTVITQHYLFDVYIIFVCHEGIPSSFIIIFNFKIFFPFYKYFLNSGLDSFSSMQCVTLLREIAKSGRTVIPTLTF